MTRLEKSELKDKLARLRADLEELTRNLPPHGLKPAQMLKIEELEDEIEGLEGQIAD